MYLYAIFHMISIFDIHPRRVGLRFDVFWSFESCKMHLFFLNNTKLTVCMHRWCIALIIIIKIIIIVITMTMFMVLSSWQSHCEIHSVHLINVE